MHRVVTKAQARRFLLKKQLLLPPQALLGENAIEDVFQHLRIIQYDPLNPCGRNPDLVLQSRIRNYHPDGYHRWLYREKKGIECYDKELCIIPIEDFSLTNHRRILVQDRVDQKQFLQKYQKEIEALLLRIEKEGALSSRDIKDITRVDSGWGTDALFGRIALETLWRMGRLVITRRVKGIKYYDLPHKIHPSITGEDILGTKLTKEHIMRRLKSVGLLPISGSGGGWQGLGGVSRLLKQLVDKGELVEVQIEGVSRNYVINPSDSKSLMQADQPISKKRLVFLAPLDNLMWDRQMILELFNFHYRWEVYAPVAKRKFGYYVLPILYGDELIGRIEPVLTKDRKLEIKGFWQEDKKQWNKEVRDAFAEGLDTFKNYLNTTEVINLPEKPASPQ